MIWQNTLNHSSKTNWSCYVGHGDGKAGDGLLVNDLEDNPNCVLLLDEIEKGHPDIMSVLLALMDDGVITGLKQVKKYPGKNTSIIMTSNLGARQREVKSIGFSSPLHSISVLQKQLITLVLNLEIDLMVLYSLLHYKLI